MSSSARSTSRTPALMRRVPSAFAAALGAILLVASAPAVHAEEVEASISIKNHKFEPAELKVPSGKAIKLTVNNLDDQAEEFESHDLRIEKVIGAKQSAIVRLKPLDKGKYSFFGEYHEATAQGNLIAD